MPQLDEEKNRVLPRTLYLVATPIGNLSDLSSRALKILSEVDFIAAEDTRNTQKLLSCFNIHGKGLVSYFEHNKRQKGEYIADRIQAGESCALVTDAGSRRQLRLEKRFRCRPRKSIHRLGTCCGSTIRSSLCRAL